MDNQLHEPYDGNTEVAALKAENEALQRRLNWAANELLACDYGDNSAEGAQVGWIVCGWRDQKAGEAPHHEKRRIYGATINAAIDAELDKQ